MHIEQFGKFCCCFCASALFPWRLMAAFQLSAGPLGFTPQRHVESLDWVPPTDTRKLQTQTEITMWLHTISEVIRHTKQ